MVADTLSAGFWQGLLEAALQLSVGLVAEHEQAHDVPIPALHQSILLECLSMLCMLAIIAAEIMECMLSE